jgi:hypothetical protein
VLSLEPASLSGADWRAIRCPATASGRHFLLWSYVFAPRERVRLTTPLVARSSK